MRGAALVFAIIVGMQGTAPDAVLAEFRIFAGAEEITATTRLRIMPTGLREKAVVVTEAKRLVASLAPAIYDVQALRLRAEGIVAIKWAERLVVMRYPDEEGRHLEVINFEAGYGALQLRPARGSMAEYDVAVFPAGDRTAAAAAPLDGEGYRLFVLRAGRYDIRTRHTDESQEPRWINDFEVPADRTRVKFVGS